jgi:predicted HTH domain antitoxin
VGYTPSRLSDAARRHLAAELFSNKTLSLEQAGQLAGMSLWDFIPFLGKKGIPVADYDEEETNLEMESAQWLSRKGKK